MLSEAELDRVCVVLVRARNPSNIGAVARARRFLIEHPAGDRQELSEQVAAAGAKPVKYEGLMADQQYESGKTSWWWPCPVCRWPMAVTGDSVRCRYRPHQAAYQVMRVKPGSQPRRQPTQAEP